MGPPGASVATAEIAADIKKLLKKLEFPTVVLEAIGQLQKLLATFVGMNVSQQVRHPNCVSHLRTPSGHPIKVAS